MSHEDAQKTLESSHNLNIIPGRDLKLMRLAAGLSTTAMAEAIGVKSRKTIENWETGSSNPGMNQWLHYCFITGFEPAKVIREALKRNEADPSGKQDINLKACKKQEK